MRTQADLMHAAGFASAVEAAEALGLSHVGTVHRMIKKGALTAERAGARWYVSGASVLSSASSSPTLHAHACACLARFGVTLQGEKQHGKGKRVAVRKAKDKA